MVSVRQTGGLPRASFRFHVAMNTLAFGYVLTATRSHSGLSPVRVRPCWANINKAHKCELMVLGIDTPIHLYQDYNQQLGYDH